MSEVGLCLSNIDNLQLVDVLAKAALMLPYTTDYLQ